jgi:hypothetical protein
MCTYNTGFGGRDDSVGTATLYGLDGPGFKSLGVKWLGLGITKPLFWCRYTSTFLMCLHGIIEVDLYLVEIFALCYVALIGGETETFRDNLSVLSLTLKMVPIGYPETSVTTNLRCIIYSNSENRI